MNPFFCLPWLCSQHIRKYINIIFAQTDPSFNALDQKTTAQAKQKTSHHYLKKKKID